MLEETLAGSVLSTYMYMNMYMYVTLLCGCTCTCSCTFMLEIFQFDGLSVAEGSKAIADSAHNQGFGSHMTQYRLRDWLISRQRYWGAPIPILYCDKCGVSLCTCACTYTCRYTILTEL